MITMPQIIQKDESGVERYYDLPSRLFTDRIILLNSEIDDDVAASIVSQLLYLDSLNNDEIKIYINSPGGSITSGLAIYDVLNNIKSPVSTICFGMAASMGAFLLSSGTRGKRYATKYSTIMIHQPLGGFPQSQASDIQIYAERILHLKKTLFTIQAKNCDMSYKEMLKACDRDNYLTAEEALKFGIIDKIIDFIPKAWKKEESEDK